MPVNRHHYVIVNIWTSANHPALPGANCGHASMTLSNGRHISLWPGKRKNKPYKTEHFQKVEKLLGTLVSDFTQRPATYKHDYEQDCVLEALHEENYREISDISELKEGETLYRFNRINYSFERLSDIPRCSLDTHSFYAIRPIPATFRVVFYSLDEEDVEAAFDNLQEETIAGWSMAGSNLLTRNFNEQTKENCASLVYRCLRAGGLYNELKSKLSSQTFSAVSPDDLLRHLVAAKERELAQYPEELAEWRITGVEETSLERIKKAFADKGLEANAEKDIIPELKPSGATCSIT